MSDAIREFGIRLLMTKLKLVGSPIEFFRQTQIKHWNVAESVSHCTKVYKDVLWMRMLEESEGMRLPNGCRLPIFIPFYSKIKYYRFRNLVPRHDYVIENMEEYIKTRPWSYHGIKVG